MPDPEFVPTLEEKTFQHYLKQFRPLPAEPLPIEERPYAVSHPLFWAWSAGVALIILAFILTFRHASQVVLVDPIRVESPTADTPLTLRSANELLSRVGSAKAVVDVLGFPRANVPAPPGMQSALHVLSKEDTKL